MLHQIQLENARAFMWRAARVVDRRRFEILFDDGSADHVIDALRAYRNDDGGFGHGLEPDIRGPESQPLQVYTALLILDEIGAFNDPMLGTASDYLTTVTAPDGGVPAMVPTSYDVPHAPWMSPPEGAPPGSLLPTAGIAGLLHKNGISHPWLGPASTFCWNAIGAIETTHPYEVKFALAFLDHAPERERAEREAERVGRLIREQNLVIVDRASATDDMSPSGYAPGEFH
ncbi:MAG: hypothetical protein WBW04_01820, partial [Nitrolancea sp.]